ncbi:MAG: type II toxin-antitoxin system RelE/ParE family toxin [Nanoarchaeota archaeon]|nr:type II toxin-antitoxin system RelE/ParE family toxin [Nanoarchaeota archaeon]MBU1103799.1 type II toxin-antitoxin system RelE/ParE family toxin [Nanoarchaeota archaeon]
MTWKIEFSSKAERFLKKLPKDISLRILNKFKLLQQNPFRFLEHYEGANCFKFRIGDYRALVDIDFDRKILLVRVFDKRGRIYKR